MNDILFFYFRYSCKEGMALFNSGGTQIDTMTSTCQWDQTWRDSDTLGYCQCNRYPKYDNIIYITITFYNVLGTHCISEPPLPPPASNLKMVNWDGKPVPIGNVKYSK